MNPIAIFFRGIWDTFRLFKMWLLIFLLIFVLAATVAVPFANVMQNSIGQSLELQKLLPEYDHTVFSDFRNVHGDKLSGILGQLFWMAPLFLLFYVFMSGGIVKAYDQIGQKFSFQEFWGNCTRYFWRFFRLFAWLLLFQGVLAGIVYGVAFFIVLGGSWDNLRTETPIINAAKIVIPIHLILATFLAMVGDYTKVRLVKHGNWLVIEEFFKAEFMCIRYFFRTYFAYLLDIVLLVGIYVLYWFLAGKIGMASTSAILIMLIIQTLTMFFRLGTRLFALGSVNAMYDGIYAKENPASEEEAEEDEATVVAPVALADTDRQEDRVEDEFDEEDQDYNEREHITDWSPYTGDGGKL